MSQNEVEVIIILGPHRSGTSLFAKFVSCYGYEFTENLIPKNKYNQKGYFEDKDIIDFNEKLLKSVNFTWNKNQFIDNKLQNSKIITDVNLDLAKKLIRNKLFQNNKIILKDPRFSILINFWKKVFSEIQVRTKYICLLRNPIEVSLSMLRRDTTSITYGLCLWSIYILEIIKNCNYNNFLFISLNTFQNNPEKTKEILNKYLSKKLEKDEFEKYLSDFYSKDLFSTRLNENILENEILINKEFRNIYQSLLSLVDDYNEDNLFKVKQKLDEVRNNLDLNKNFELLDWEYEKILSDNKTNDGKYNEKIKQFEIEKSKSLRIIQNADKSIKEESRILTTQQKRIERDHEELKNKLTEFEDYKSVSLKDIERDHEELKNKLTEFEDYKSVSLKDIEKRQKDLNRAIEKRQKEHQIRLQEHQIRLQAHDLQISKEHQIRLQEHQIRLQAHDLQISKDMELIESQTVNIQREASNIKKSKKYIKELLLINDHLQKKQDIQSNNLNIRKIIKYRIKKLFIKLNIYDLYFLLRYQKINPIKKLKKINLPPEKILYDQLSENIKKVCDQINFKELKQVTIIIPVYGKWDYTIRCLDSLYKIKTKYNFEVIIMDDNSKSLPPDVIMQNSNKDNKNIVYYKNNKNLGFIKNCNKGSELANGKYIVFLNNDTHVFEDWLDELIMTFDKKDDVGIVGSKIIYENQKLQEAGGIIWNDGTGMNFGKGDIQSHPRYNYIKEVDYVSGCSLAIKKSLFIETGKFDDDLQVAYYEDAAKCFQIRDQGYKVIYQPKSVLVHYEGVTNGKDTTSGIKSYQEVNRSIFKKKYLSNRKHSYYDYQKYKNEKNIRLANEIYKKERILIIDNCIPTPDLDEGSLYMWNLIKFLKNDSNLVKFIPAEELHEARSNYFENMRQIGVECAALPHYSSVKNFIIEHKDVFTKAIITRVNNCDNYINIVRKYNKSIKIIFNTIDLHHLREMRQAKIEDNKSIKSQAEYMKKIEMNCIEKSDVTVVVSEEEKSYLITEGIDKNKIEVLPLLREANNFDIAPYDERENKIIFIGNFNHQPNVDGINYFLENIYPYVSTKLKSFKNIEIELEIIGSNMPAELQKKIKDSKLNVTYRGYVKNLNNILSKAKLSIAPLRYGAGLKGKIISSFENGLPVLGSKVAFEGISIDSLTKNTELIVENEDEYFLSISKLLFDKDEWNNISKKLKNIVTKNYSVKSNTSKIQKIIY